jgi:tRNA (cmo5U34)-methyltransferase
MNTPSQEWSDRNKSTRYLKNIEANQQRKLGELVLLQNIPEKAMRIMDLGSGDGRLIKLIKENSSSKPDIEFVALDISPVMLQELKKSFSKDSSVRVIDHDLDTTLPDLGYFDVIVSSFAIHHLKHRRKYTLYEEIYEMLNPLGVFCNLEHVASVSIQRHIRFFDLIGEPLDQEEKTDKTLTVERQMQMLREIGFVEVDCLWKWYEMALLVAHKI